MRVLHLTDLHTDATGTALQLQWSRARPLVGRFGPFDAVVISGDLTAHGRRDEFTALTEFLKSIEALVENGRRAIILVPGNHDVDWAAHSLDEPGEILDDEIKAYGKSPEGSPLRIRFGREGITKAGRIGSKYANRFTQFQAFLSEFYGQPLNPDYDRLLDVTKPNEEEHWSAHFFFKSKTSFCGFNSCHKNDSIWTGACISERAILKAAEHVERNAPEFVRVAVWHHGLTSERGHPDYLTVNELSRLAESFHIGIHGHTHMDESKSHLWGALRAEFPVIATGSFTASPEERPGGVSNQFSVIDIAPNYVRTTLCTYDENKGGGWSIAAQNFYEIRPSPSAARRTPPSATVEKHTRHVSIDPKGMGSVEIGLEGVRLTGSLVLACPAPGYNNINYDRECKTDRGERKIATDPDPNVHRYRLEPSGEKPETHKAISWSYRISNAFAFDNVDAEFGHKSKRYALELKEDEDAYVHHLQTWTEELTLKVTFVPSEGRTSQIASARPIVQSQIYGGATDGSNQLWKDEEEDGQALSCVIEGPSIKLVVPRPRVGYRYGIVYKVGRSRDAMPLDEVRLLQRVVEDCRSRQDQAVAKKLTRTLRANISQVFMPDEKGKAPIGFWIAHLWHDRESRLLPTFGDFPPRVWGSEFAYGSGVAGHAFRMGGPAVYYYDEKNADKWKGMPTSRLLYRKGRGNRKAKGSDWIVSVPILLTPKKDGVAAGPAVGVVSFCDYDGGGTGLVKLLAKLAETVVTTGDPATRERELARLDRCSNAISAAFWLLLESEPELGSPADKIYRDHWAPKEPAPGA